MIAALFDRALYVEPDPQSLKEAEQRAERELLAQSCVVSRAKRDYSQWWAQIDARRQTPRLRLVPGRGEARS
jgi:hypothetical protein